MPLVKEVWEDLSKRLKIYEQCQTSTLLVLVDRLAFGSDTKSTIDRTKMDLVQKQKKFSITIFYPRETWLFREQMKISALRLMAIFLGLIELIAKYDPILSELFNSYLDR